MGGSPKYRNPSTSDKNQYAVDFPIKIDLRAASPGFPVSLQESFFALVLTRYLSYARIDGQVGLNEIPKVFNDLMKDLPRRGQIASKLSTLVRKPGFDPTTTLLDWGKTHEGLVKKANTESGTVIRLISDRELMYPGGYPSASDPGGILHAGLLPEFGWESWFNRISQLFSSRIFIIKTV